MVDTITVSPLGVRFAGTFEDYDEDIIDGIFAFRVVLHLGKNVTLETLDGDVSLGHISTALPMRPYMTFSSLARADSPIDVDSVTAVVVDGVRIPLE